MNQSSLKTASLGIQHVLAMYAGAVIVPLIVGGALGLTGEQLTYLVSIDIFMCGIATLLQVWKNKFFGIGLPVVLGCRKALPRVSTPLQSTWGSATSPLSGTA